MERRLAGMVLLLVALTVIVAVPRLLAPQLVARPLALPLPEPPAVGACLELDPTVAEVPCSDVHAAEVTAHWPADSPGRPTGTGESRCRAAAFEYVGLGLVGSAQVWRPAFGAHSRLLSAPPAQRAGDRGWSACVIRPARTMSSVGSVRDQGVAPSTRPAAFGLCVTGGGVVVSCDQPHRIEYLTEAVGFAGSLVGGASATRWRTGCSDLATELLGNPDPTLGGKLAVEFMTLAADPQTGFDPPSSIVFALCAVAVTGDRDLRGSLFGLGDADLPLV
ncbi:MAG: hypothetical protein ABJA16_12185 [Nakamurella sp.]